MEVRPRFLRNSKLKPTDVYFVPADSVGSPKGLKGRGLPPGSRPGELPLRQSVWRRILTWRSARRPTASGRYRTSAHGGDSDLTPSRHDPPQRTDRAPPCEHRVRDRCGRAYWLSAAASFGGALIAWVIGVALRLLRLHDLRSGRRLEMAQHLPWPAVPACTGGAYRLADGVGRPRIAGLRVRGRPNLPAQPARQ